MILHRMKAAQCERDGDGDAAYRHACNDMRAAVRIVSRWRASRGGAAASFHAAGAIVGAVMCADAAYAHADSRWRDTAPGLEQMRVDDEERRSILVEERADFANTVPLEEALIVNDSSQRRSLVMSILNDNPSRYIDVLSQARLNEDVEVVHYAATAMAQISAKEDLALQRCRNDYLQHRNSEAMLERYCDALERYINSGIAQGYALQLQKQRYAEVLQERLRQHGDYYVACRLAQMQIDLGLFDDAAHTIDGAMEQWPDQGDVWLMRLRLDAARNDGDALRHTVQQIESKHIYLGGQGRRVLRFWTGTKEAERA